MNIYFYMCITETGDYGRSLPCEIKYVTEVVTCERITVQTEELMVLAWGDLEQELTLQSLSFNGDFLEVFVIWGFDMYVNFIYIIDILVAFSWW